MLLANNNNDDRISPHKGGRGFCPFCNGTVIAVCGEINIHHWRHDIKSNCDPWKESETEWHRRWKERFPNDWRESIIIKSGQKHIADVKTNFGLIVEFQNSPISSSTIKIRESFYENMIWVINAEKFKEFFLIRSVVKNKLKLTEFERDHVLSNMKDMKDEKDFDNEIGDISRELRYIKACIKSESDKIENYKDFLYDIDNTVEVLIKPLFFCTDLEGFNSENISKLSECRNIDAINDKEKEIKNRIELIDTLANSTIPNFENYKSVSFKQVRASSYKKCKLFYTNTINSFFPKEIPLHSESDFSWYSRKPNEFSLIMDLNKDREELEEKLIEVEVEKGMREKQEQAIYSQLKKELENWLKEQIRLKKEQIGKLGLQRDELIGDIKDLEVEREKSQKMFAEECAYFENAVNQEYEQKLSSIKRKYKGLYSYTWKYRRKSWDFSKCQMYLDFGNHIFKMEAGDLLRKIDKDDFVKMIKRNTL